MIERKKFENCAEGVRVRLTFSEKFGFVTSSGLYPESQLFICAHLYHTQFEGVDLISVFCHS